MEAILIIILLLFIPFSYMSDFKEEFDELKKRVEELERRENERQTIDNL